MAKKSRRNPQRVTRLNASFASTGDARTVPVRYVKFVFGLFLLPVCYVLTAAFFNVLIDAFTTQVAGRPYFWMTVQFLSFSFGVVSWLGVYFSMPKWLSVYVYGHELTHAIAVKLMGGEISDFNVGPNGGHVVSSKINTWIALAPYFVPIYSVFAITIYWLTSLFVDLTPHRDLAAGLLAFSLGFTWCFHACFTLAMIPKGQSDLHYGGTFFSLTIIYVMNLLVLSVLLIVATPYVSFASFGREILVQAQAFAVDAVSFFDAFRRAYLR